MLEKVPALSFPDLEGTYDLYMWIQDGHALLTGLDVVDLEGTPIITHRVRLLDRLTEQDLTHVTRSHDTFS